MVYARERNGQRLSRLGNLLVESSRDARVVAALAGLSCGVVLALLLPRIGPWSLVLMLPLCFAAGYVWGHRARAAESRKAIDTLKSRLAHELNNPLAILIDQLDSAVSALERTSLTQGTRRAPELKAVADEALAAATRIARVVRDLDDTSPVPLERSISSSSERHVKAQSGPIPKPVRARILVIDDEPQVAASLRRMLYRHDVTIATTGFEAQSLIQHHEFDVIVSDVMMPEPSGMDVFERLTRTDPDLARRFVFVTGGTYTNQARDFLGSIPNIRLGKPVDAPALERAIAGIHQGIELSALSS